MLNQRTFCFDAQRNVRLSDFGISLLSSPVPQEVAGTLPYMALEQQEGQTAFASDQYALGIVVFEWLCGVRPFDGPADYRRGGVVTPPRLREKDPSLPETIEAVVLKALAKDPQDRYPSVLQFARALEMAVQRSTSNINSSDERTYSPHTDVSRRIFLSTPIEQAQNTVPTDPFVAQLKADLETRDIIVVRSRACRRKCATGNPRGSTGTTSLLISNTSVMAGKPAPPHCKHLSALRGIRTGC